MKLPKPIARVIESFEKLPGIGPKSAQRLAFHLLRIPESEIENFSQNILELKQKILFCDICRNLDENPVCSICSDLKREGNKIIVVSSPLDVFAFEKVGFKGKYQVLHGNIDPLNNVGPEELKINLLIKRLRDLIFEGNDVEIILATSTSLEGESTSMFISKMIKENISDFEKVKISRIARGIPVGGDIEYADDITLSRALEGRNQF
ncbi:recombination protein RecR [bacterium]|jgi:recombination protein RecR|nr:recombination protein RecR [bacterium]NBO36776.1 recombination protein RecR [bacterium]